MSRGHCIVSHGFESGPRARKVSALAEQAQRLGWTVDCPDYTDLDQQHQMSPLGDVLGRLQRLLQCAQTVAPGPLVLAGSSLGAYICARVAMQVPCAAVFLLAPPIALGHLPAIVVPQALPAWVIHGWADERIPVEQVIAWAQTQRTRLLLVDDDHSLGRHLPEVSLAFASLLATIATD